jgi:hypothetical protein
MKNSSTCIYNILTGTGVKRINNLCSTDSEPEMGHCKHIMHSLGRAMRSGFIRFIALGCLLIGFSTLSPSQSEFDRGHALLQQLSRDQRNTQTQLHRERLTEKVKSVPLEVERLLNKGILLLLNTKPSLLPEELRQKLNAALETAPPDQNNETMAFVFPFDHPQRPSYVIAYYTGYCAICSRSWIGIVGPKEDRYEIVASIENSLPNLSLTVVPLGAGVGGSTRFLAYGRSWGDAHGRLNAIAYSFDGQHLQKIWSREGLPQGKITVTQAEIVLSFLTSLRPRSRERTEVYNITPEGISRRHASERPGP